jgi:hypothetical protein
MRPTCGIDTGLGCAFGRSMSPLQGLVCGFEKYQGLRPSLRSFALPGLFCAPRREDQGLYFRFVCFALLGRFAELHTGCLTQ